MLVNINAASEQTHETNPVQFYVSVTFKNNIVDKRAVKRNNKIYKKPKREQRTNISKIMYKMTKTGIK